jgi:hypothetical protein
MQTSRQSRASRSLSDSGLKPEFLISPLDSSAVTQEQYMRRRERYALR